MRELVLAGVPDQPDIEVIVEAEDENQLADMIADASPVILILTLDDAGKRIAQCGFLLGRHPQMKIIALAPEKNRGLFYWATVDVRTKPMASSEAGRLSALREGPSLVGTTIT